MADAASHGWHVQLLQQMQDTLRHRKTAQLHVSQSIWCRRSRTRCNSVALRLTCRAGELRTPESRVAPDFSGDPNGIRTRVFAVKGRCPRPLDDRVAPPKSSSNITRQSTLSRAFCAQPNLDPPKPVGLLMFEVFTVQGPSRIKPELELALAKDAFAKHGQAHKGQNSIGKKRASPTKSSRRGSSCNMTRHGDATL